ncbi:MAG: hypothetical protein IKD77_01270 [Bacilli bacterium]|nr:hypothetical protein [Bacilli bacterium]
MIEFNASNIGNIVTALASCTTGNSALIGAISAADDKYVKSKGAMLAAARAGETSVTNLQNNLEYVVNLFADAGIVVSNLLFNTITKPTKKIETSEKITKNHRKSLGLSKEDTQKKTYKYYKSLGLTEEETFKQIDKDRETALKNLYKKRGHSDAFVERMLFKKRMAKGNDALQEALQKEIDYDYYKNVLKIEDEKLIKRAMGGKLTEEDKKYIGYKQVGLTEKQINQIMTGNIESQDDLDAIQKKIDKYNNKKLPELEKYYQEINDIQSAYTSLYRKSLEKQFSPEDAKRIASGKISAEELIKEILNSNDQKRINAFVEKIIVPSTGYKSLEDMEKAINEVDSKFQKNIDNCSNEKEKKYLVEILIMIKNGATLDEALSKGNVWKGPRLVSYRDALAEETKKWLEELFLERQSIITLKKDTEASMEECKINLRMIYLNADFEEYCYANQNVLEKVKGIHYNPQNPVVYTNDKEMQMAIITAAINGIEVTYHGGNIYYKNSMVSFKDEELANHIAKWIPDMDDDQKKIYNYLYNKRGADAAYNYLTSEPMKTVLDMKYYRRRQEEDAKWAKENPIPASIASVAITPFEGLIAMKNTTKTQANNFTRNENRQTYRTDAYSAGNVYRSAVSEDVGSKYGEFAKFVYDGTMSMADFAVIAVPTVLSGGTLSGVLVSAMTFANMGTRVYVSAYNNGRDKGLSESKAIGEAWAFALVESAIERIPLGNLSAIAKGSGLGSKFLASSMERTALNQSANSAKSALIKKHISNVLGQSVVEGNEELLTDIVDDFIDRHIAGVNSDFNLSVHQYLSKGLSREEAEKKATEDLRKDWARDWALGVFSGTAFGGGTSAYASRKGKNPNYSIPLNNDVKSFVTSNNIDVNKIRQMVDTTIYSAKDLGNVYSGFEHETVQKKVSVANIVGFDYAAQDIAPEAFASLNDFFDSSDGEYSRGEYSKRSLGLLKLSPKTAISDLQDSFEKEQIHVSEVAPGKYVVTENGMHRYALLRALYLSELAEVGDNQEAIEALNKKYEIPVQARIPVLEEGEIQKSNEELLRNISDRTKATVGNTKSALGVPSTVTTANNGFEVIIPNHNLQSDPFSKILEDLNETYKGYDKVLRVSNLGLENALTSSEVINNPNENILVEIPNTNELSLEIIEKIPDNVSIRIIGSYTLENLNREDLNKQTKIAVLEKVTYTKEELVQIMTEINKIESQIDSNWNEYEKALFIYEYLKKNIKYHGEIEIKNYEKMTGGKTGQVDRNRHYDTLTGLIDKISTCNGYAFMYQELLNRQGIKCYRLNGRHGKAGQHAWNAVTINNQTFLVDIIWDSMEYEKGNNVTTGFGVLDASKYTPRGELTKEIFSNLTKLNENFVQSELSKINEVSKKNVFANLSTAKLLEKTTDVLSVTEDTLPEGYQTVDQYKKEFVTQMIDSGAINDLDANTFASIASDSVMLESLVGTDALDNFVIKNSHQMKLLSNEILSKLTQEKFNELFSRPSIKDYIDNLSVSQLSRILEEFYKSNNGSWLGSDTFVNRITNMDIENFYELLDETRFPILLSSSIAQGNQHINQNYLKILDSIINKFGTKEILQSNLDYKFLINYFKPISFAMEKIDNNEIVEKLKAINDLQNEIDSQIKNNIIASSQVELQIDNNGNLIAVTDEPKRYYKLTYEINGNKKSMEITNLNSDSINLSNLMRKENLDIMNAALAGTLQLKSLTIDETKSNLVIPNEQFENGLNEVTLLVNGKEEKRIIKAGYIDIDLNSYFPNAKTAEFVSIKSLGSFDIETDGNSNLYAINIRRNGQNTTYYLTPTENTIFNTHTLNIDKFITDNNITDIESLSVSPANYENITDNFSGLNNNVIFNEQQYGGSQGDIYNLINKSITGQQLSDLEQKKAKLLKDIIQSYYPGITENQMTLLAANISSHGCKYMAIANSLSTWFNNQPNGAVLFESNFGFPLSIKSNEPNSFNTEAIALDMALYMTKQVYNYDVDSAIFSDSLGLSSMQGNNHITNYFAERGISLTITSPDLNKNSHLQEGIVAAVANNNNSFCILGAENFDLQFLDGTSHILETNDAATSNVVIDGDVAREIGPHAMLVTGISDDGNLIVSSWGGRAKFLSDSINSQNDHLILDVLDFSLMEDDLNENFVQSELSKIDEKHENLSQDSYQNDIVDAIEKKEQSEQTKNNMFTQGNASFINEEIPATESTLPEGHESSPDYNRTVDTNEPLSPTQDTILQQVDQFFKIDAEIKDLLYNSAPNVTEDPVECSDRMWKLVSKIESKFKRLCDTLGFDYNMIKPSIENAKKQIMEANYSYQDFARIYNECFAKITDSTLKSIGENVNIHAPGAGILQLINGEKSFNEILHILHSTVLNSNEMLRSISEIETYVCPGGNINFSVSLRGQANENARDIFNTFVKYCKKIPPKYQSFGYTDFIAIDDKKILFQVRDAGHCTTGEIIKQDDGQFGVSYIIPKITNDEMVSKVKGINGFTKGDIYAVGTFLTSSESLAEDISELIMSIPGDSQYANYEGKITPLAIDYLKMTDKNITSEEKTKKIEELSENHRTVVGNITKPRELTTVDTKLSRINEIENDLLFMYSYYYNANHDSNNIPTNSSYYEEAVEYERLKEEVLEEFGFNKDNIGDYAFMDRINSNSTIEYCLRSDFNERKHISGTPNQLRQLYNIIEKIMPQQLYADYNLFNIIAEKSANDSETLEQNTSNQSIQENDNYSEIETTLQNLEDAIAEYESEAKELANETRKLEQQRTNLTKQQETQDNSSEISSKIKQLTEKITENNGKLMETISKRDGARAEIERLSNDLEALENALESTELELDYIEDLGFVILNQEPDKYYTVTYYDNTTGNTSQEDVVSTKNGYVRLESIRQVDVLEQAREGKIKIKSLELNEAKSNLRVDISNVEGNLIKIKAKIDGEEKIYTCIKRKDQEIAILAYINNYIPFKSGQRKTIESLESNPTSAEIISIESANIPLDNNVFIYEVTKYVGETKIKSYMTADDLTKNSAVWENVTIEPVYSDEIIEKFPYISHPHILSPNNYGGNQSDVTTLMAKHLSLPLFKLKNFIKNGYSSKQSEVDKFKGQVLESLIKKYYPEARDIDLANLAEVYSKHGCGYMAIANAFAIEISKLPNGERLFYDNFGYPLFYREGFSKSYNLEALAFDLFLNIQKNNLNYSIQEVLKEADGFHNHFYLYTESFFAEHNIKFNYTLEYIDFENDPKTNLLKILFGNEGYHIISAYRFDLDKLPSNKTRRDVGSHAMLVTEISDDKELIVSSWSGKYKFKSDSIVQYDDKVDKNGKEQKRYLQLTTINFSLMNQEETINQNIPSSETIDTSHNESVNANSSTNDTLEPNVPSASANLSDANQKSNLRFNPNDLVKIYYNLYDANNLFVFPSKDFNIRIKRELLKELQKLDADSNYTFSDEQLKVYRKLKAEIYSKDITLEELIEKTKTDLDDISKIIESNGSTEELLQRKETLEKRLETYDEIQSNINKLSTQYAEKYELTLKEYAALKYNEAFGLGLFNKNDPDKQPPKMPSEEEYAVIKAKATEIREKALEAEPEITEDMRSLETTTRYLIGEEFKVKREERLAEKIIGDCSENYSEEKINLVSSDIGDSLRYTLLLEPNDYVQGIEDSLSFLLDKGYKIKYNSANNESKLKIIWNEGEKYHGVNVQLEKTVNGKPVVFELQFHTLESFVTKDKLTHEFYEIERNDFLTDESKKLARKIQIDYQSTIDVPEGIRGSDLLKKFPTLDATKIQESQLEDKFVGGVLKELAYSDAQETKFTYKNITSAFKKHGFSKLSNLLAKSGILSKGYDNFREFSTEEEFKSVNPEVENWAKNVSSNHKDFDAILYYQRAGFRFLNQIKRGKINYDFETNSFSSYLSGYLVTTSFDDAWQLIPDQFKIGKPKNYDSFIKIHEEIADCLEEKLSLELSEPTIVYRGVGKGWFSQFGLSRSANMQEIKRKIDDVIGLGGLRETGFMSTSYSIYGKFVSSTDILLKYNMPKGQKYGALFETNKFNPSDYERSVFYNECELLFPPGLDSVIKNVYFDKNGVLIIEMQVD